MPHIIRFLTVHNSIHRNLKLIFIYHAIIHLFFLNAAFGLSVQSNSIKEIAPQPLAIEADSEIELKSGWYFYWNKLIEPGHFDKFQPTAVVGLDSWTKYEGTTTKSLPSFGYATYRLLISIPENRPHTSLYIPKAYAASKLWINRKLISEIGKVGTSKSETRHRRYVQIIPLDDHDTEFEIVIQVANFYHSKAGFDQPLRIASSERLNDVKSKRIIADMLFIGSLGFIGLFFLLFYLFYWNKDKAILYFSMICLGLSYMALSDRYAPLAGIFESVSWIFLTKIEYISLFLAGTAAGLFVNAIFFRFTHKAYSIILKSCFGLLNVLVLILPRPYFTKLLPPFLILMIFNIVYVFFVIIKSMIVDKRRESILLLVSTIFGATVFSLHIFVFFDDNASSIIYVNFGYVIAFLLLSMLLMVRFSNAFEELETTKEVALHQKKEISFKSKELSKINLELKENLIQLENYNSELEGFNRIVSHDLKAPLVAMHSLVSFIEEDTKINVGEETVQHFNLLKDRISKMNDLINGLLEYSKVARGNKTKDRFSFNDLLEEVFASVNHDNRNIINLPKQDIEVFANKIELKHVFHNLINNAIKHNDKDQTIITISIIEQKGEYEFSIKDNGPGIEEKYHSKIFEMFTRIDGRHKSGSTGVGLSIVKRIVLENKGHISVDSERGMGTLIKFTWKI